MVHHDRIGVHGPSHIDDPGVACYNPFTMRLMDVSQILFGSDYPHGEGCAEPGEVRQVPMGPGANAVRTIMRDNTRGLLGL